MKRESGFTLVELMVVIVIVGIVAASALVFPPLLEKNRVESYTKEIQTLLIKARNDASNFNAPCTITFAANQITTAIDKNRDGLIETTSKNYPDFTIGFSANPMVFDRKGLTNDGQTIEIQGYSSSKPTVDCIRISATRINVGKKYGTNCVQQ